MESNQISIECSLETFIKQQNDIEEYEDDMIEEVQNSDPLDYLDEDNNELDDNIELEEDIKFDHTSEANYSDANQPRDVWFEAPTRLLLKCIEEMQPKLGKTFAFKNKQKMWQQIHKVMVADGYTFSVAQVQGRFRSLERRYRRTKQLELINSDRKRQPFLYKDEVEKILFKNKRKRPEYILDSKEKSGTSKKVLTGETGSSEKSYTYSSGIEDSDGPVIKRKKKTETSHEKLCKCLQNIDKRQVDYNREMLKILQKKNEIEEKRNEILEKICEKLTKP
ncbi:uncharacterized protein LOC129910882 [Episyrphus balteatus]|uniref:uncharacterized protein LOC129910882 n=1 Tax=Episyrphus balteatus TaxID=286459 RepID=UPI00248664C4|nr:uncharacterized protein LOC129910882 [Episyrphus balteatus]